MAGLMVREGKGNGGLNNVWSEHIQGVLTLYLSRKLRFDDFFMNQYTDFFDLDNRKSMRILEIGCGPGALSGALHRWYPEAEIIGIDRDCNFVNFARRNEPGIEFIEGDATCLPFGDSSFDVTISNTVCEHIAPELFYAEQRRVLKDHGVCFVLSVRKGINCIARCLEQTEAERRFWDSIGEDDVMKKYGIGKYAMTEQQHPIVMEKNGFSDVSTGYAVIPLTPDNPKIPVQMSEGIVNAERNAAIEALLSTHSDKAEAIIDIVKDKYDMRLQLLRNGEKQWDTYTTVTMLMRGVKK